MTHAPGLQSGCSGLEQRVSLLATRRGKDDDNRLNSVIVCLKHSQVPSGSAWNELEGVVREVGAIVVQYLHVMSNECYPLAPTSGCGIELASVDRSLVITQ
eukprot:scaffold70707_cov16-Tisochrysis_lutea.AAC.1